MAGSPFAYNGGEAEIRTPGTFLYTRFPGVLLKPLGHLSSKTKKGKIAYCKGIVNVFALIYKICLLSTRSLQKKAGSYFPSIRTGRRYPVV